MAKEAPFIHVEDSSHMDEVWRQANHTRYYSLGARVQKQLDRLDAWAERHHVGLRVAEVMFLIAAAVAVVNLELGRPWF